MRARENDGVDGRTHGNAHRRKKTVRGAPAVPVKTPSPAMRRELA